MGPRSGSRVTEPKAAGPRPGAELPKLEAEVLQIMQLRSNPVILRYVRFMPNTRGRKIFMLCSIRWGQNKAGS